MDSSIALYTLVYIVNSVIAVYNGQETFEKWEVKYPIH